MTKLPKLVVFDLDYTLWPFYVGHEVDYPFSRAEDGSVVDSSGAVLKPYLAVGGVLECLKEDGVLLAAASSGVHARAALQLLQLLGWRHLFADVIIGPGCKKQHFCTLRDRLGVQFEEMLFFDDEARNLRDVGGLGVAVELVDKSLGMTTALLRDALGRFAATAS